MSIADFLFNGKAPQSVTKYGTATTNLPQWFSDFQQGIASRGNAIAAEPYDPYGGPRIAGFTGDQTNAFSSIRNGMGNESGLINKSALNAARAGQQANAYEAAAPWLKKSGQAAYDTVGKYMNPYTDAVVNRIGELGARNLQENLMPAINSDFIRAGQYGSSGQMAEVGKALRDTQESVLAQQNQALEQGYGQAMQAAQTDASRFGQIGQAFGNLSNMDTNARLSGAKTAGALGTLAQTSRYNDINALMGIGDKRQNLNQSNLNLAHQDFLDQRDYQKNQLSWLNNLVKGFQMPTSTTTSQTAPLDGSSFTPSPFQSALGTLLTTNSLMQ